MDSELGEKALRNLMAHLNELQEFTLYTGFKNAPVSWDPSYLKFEEFFRSYPDFPNKPSISSPITRAEFANFSAMLEKHLGFEYCLDILTFERKDRTSTLTWEMSSENADDDYMKTFTQAELVDFLNQMVKCCRIDIIDARRNLDFDLRDHLATDQKPY